MALGTNPKDIAGAAKPQFGLVPLTEAVVRVMELGAAKYGPYNWRANKIHNMVYANAALRHLRAWIDGQTTDPESKQSHLAHAAACMLIVLDAEATGNAVEGRVWLPKQVTGGKCPDCGKDSVFSANGGGVKCTTPKCGYWFCH